MATSTHSKRRLFGIALGIVLLAAAVGAGVYVASGGAAASVSMGDLSVADHNATVGGDVSDVTLGTTLGFSQSVPDATRRIVRLKAGPSKDNLETIAYKQARDPTGSASGEVTLSGSLITDGPFTTADFAPVLAGTESTTVVVQAEIEVRRANGDPVTHTLTDTATVTLSDDATLTVDLGGTGSFTVETA